MQGTLGRYLPMAFACSLLSGCWLDKDVPASAAANRAAATSTANKAPTISANTVTAAVAGVEYVLSVTASDPEGAKLAFTIANKPSWASFDTQTGTLRGTPTAANVGTAANVTIAVSDGVNTAALSPFSIAVSASSPGVAAQGTATLSWQPPTQRVDGSPLSTLAGFKVHVGQSSRSYSRVIDISGASNTRYTVTGLTAGRWYFAISATDDMGLSSDLSAEVSKAF